MPVSTRWVGGPQLSNFGLHTIDLEKSSVKLDGGSFKVCSDNCKERVTTGQTGIAQVELKGSGVVVRQTQTIGIASVSKELDAANPILPIRPTEGVLGLGPNRGHYRPSHFDGKSFLETLTPTFKAQGKNLIFAVCLRDKHYSSVRFGSIDRERYHDELTPVATSPYYWNIEIRQTQIGDKFVALQNVKAEVGESISPLRILLFASPSLLNSDGDVQRSDCVNRHKCPFH